MGLVVLKFGGTSVADADAIAAVATRIAGYRAQGHRVITVISAMGHATDHLLDLAGQVSSEPPPRELDMLLATGEQVSIALVAMALCRIGCPAVSLTGWQAGIQTGEVHTRARVLVIDEHPIRRELDAGRVVVVAGFQGVSRQGQITTLGRGGSDTTAVALAAAFRADACEIFTDVDGVYTADPRLVPTARKLDRISYDEMLELAVLGAAVMHPRAVAFGKVYGVPIRVRHSRKPDPGTLITGDPPEMEQSSVVGCALKQNLGRVSLRDIPNAAGTASRIFDAIARAEVCVDDIVQVESSPSTDSISFTVDHPDLAEVRQAMESVLSELGRGELAIDVGLAKVSVVGLGMRSHTGVAAAMFKALAGEGIRIANITTSEIKISCIINRADGQRALAAVHAAFGLDRPSMIEPRALPKSRKTSRARREPVTGVVGS